MTWAATIPRAGLKEMRTHRPRTWRLTVLKTTRMTLRTDCAVSAWSRSLRLKGSCPLTFTGGVGLWTGPPHFPRASTQNAASFPFPQPYLSIGFRAVGNRAPTLRDICDGTLLGHKKEKEAMPFTATWADLEAITLRAGSQTRKANTTWHQFYVESKLGHKGTYLQNRNRLTNMQNEFMVTKEMAGGDKLGVWDFIYSR